MNFHFSYCLVIDRSKGGIRKAFVLEESRRNKTYRMKKMKSLIGIVMITLTFFNCTNNDTDLSPETTNGLNRSSMDFNEIISAGEKLVYEVSSEHVSENSDLFEEEFQSVETIDIVAYNDFQLLKVTGQNLDNAPSTQYYSMDEIVGSGTELSNGGGSGNYCSTCLSPPGIRIYYYYMQPDGTLILRYTVCFPCPPGYALSS